jgi:hypothetical protein
VLDSCPIFFDEHESHRTPRGEENGMVEKTFESDERRAVLTFAVLAWPGKSI